MSLRPDNVLEVQSVGGYPEEYFDFLSRLEADSFWFRHRNRLICWMIERSFNGARTFLEIGCGTGFVLQGIKTKYPQMDVTGAELLEEGLKFAKSRLSNANFIQADARALEFRNRFDLIGAFDVIEHIPEDRLVLQQVRQALTAGGGLLVSVPQHRWLWSASDDFACHVRRYSRAELVEKVTSAGFDVIYCSSFVSVLFPALVVSRFAQNLFRSDGDSYADLNLPRAVNVVLDWIMRVEEAMLKCGINFPFGGSLLLAARARQSE